ncbi:hypothetical protein E4U39_005353 [Claviceps sp. Clav50 group G5]|nr:hypothetical protein E4U39_005353 [Claviceps sp. Clav50 group G5]
MKHPLSNCTLYDSCGALHVVNNPDLLVPGSFKLSDAGDYLESGISSIAISERGTRVLKKIFDGRKGLQDNRSYPQRRGRSHTSCQRDDVRKRCCHAKPRI